MTGDISAWVAGAARAGPGSVFLEDARSDRQVTYRQLAQLSEDWRRRLDGAGVGPSMPVALRLDDHLGYAATFAALLAGGQLVVPLAPRAPAREEARARELTGPVATIATVGRHAALQVHAGAAGSPRRGPFAAPPGGAGVLLCTSGTSGAPKVVALVERQLAHVAAGVAAHHGLGPGDRGLSPLPLFHVNAEVVGVLATLAAQATLVVDDRFHRTGFWPLVEGRRITWVNAVPAIISVLASTPGPDTPPHRVRFVRSASAPLGAATLARFERLTGLGVLETYGMTEAASMVTANPLEGRRKPGSVGLPVNTELRVVGPVHQAVPRGRVGGVEIRGPGTITSYAVGGRSAFTDDGWLKTGDLGYLDDDGYLFLVGRADDVINRGGENIYPREVEEVLLADPRVEAALVVGLADPVLGARPVAYVVLNRAATAAMTPPPTLPQDGASGAAMADELRARCQDQLSPFKVPAQVHIVERLPVGPTGKVSRRLVGPWTTASVAGGAGPGGSVVGGSVVGNKEGAGEAVEAAAP